MAAAAPLDEILEKEWQAQVFKLARVLGWKKSYHTYDSRRSSSGFPDVVLVRDRVVYLELKREKTGCTPAQVDWLRDLNAAGAEVYVVRPRNLQALALVLARRPGLNSSFQQVAAFAAETELLQELEKEVAA